MAQGIHFLMPGVGYLPRHQPLMTQVWLGTDYKGRITSSFALPVSLKSRYLRYFHIFHTNSISFSSKTASIT